MDNKEKRIAITGGTGFVGKSLMKKINTDSFKEVRVIRSKDHDLRKLDEATEAFKDIDFVIHMAGITGGIEFTKKNQGSVYFDNITINTNVLESCRINKVKKVISIGSVCSYPKFPKLPFKEDDIWDGYPEEVNAPYGLAKKMLIVQGDAYKNQYGMSSQVLLVTNLFGPEDTFEKDKSHVVPAIIVKFYDAIINNKKEVTLWGDGSPTRDLLFIEDLTDAVLQSLFSKSNVSPINIGSGVEMSILNLATLIKEIMGGTFEIKWDTTKANGQPRRILDIERAKNELGFNPNTPFKEGLQKTIQFYVNKVSQSKT
jgi:GDP-L-fucose synthase